MVFSSSFFGLYCPRCLVLGLCLCYLGGNRSNSFLLLIYVADILLLIVSLYAVSTLLWGTPLGPGTGDNIILPTLFHRVDLISSGRGERHCLFLTGDRAGTLERRLRGNYYISTLALLTS